MAIPAPPENVVPTVNRNDKITLTWDHDPTWFAFNGDDASLGGYNEGLWYSSESVDSFDIEIIRDGTSWVAPTGGSTSVSYNPNSTSYSEAYYPNSDQPYNTQVGIDSSFKFRVRAVNADGVSNWVTSSEVYTQAIPPHNPSVSRPSANEVKIDMERQTNIGSGVVIEARADTGSGYGAWDWFDTTEVSNLPNTYQTETKYSGGWELKEDARYQFRAYHYVSQDRSMDSTEVILDYGNDGNVYFEEDFESNDLSAWRNTPGAYTSSGSGMDSGFSGADQGTYYAILDGDSKIDVSVGDLSNESDVIVKAAVAVGSADHSGEELAVDFWDGSNWRQLTDFHWEYNKQGWVEMTALVPDSYLSSNAYIRFESASGGGGDHYYIDRVVVSDILHEVTKPASLSNLSTDASVKREITGTWTENASLGSESHSHSKAFVDLDGNRVDTIYGSGSTTTGLLDGELYDFEAVHLYAQFRHGSQTSWWHSDSITDSATTIIPAPSSVSVSAVSDTSLDISWTDNANNEDGHKIKYGTVFNDLNNWSVNYGGLATDKVFEGTNSFYSNANGTNLQASWKVFDGGKQPSEFTYYYQEVWRSHGGGIRLVNSNGNYEGGTATDNPQFDVDFANKTGEIDGGSGYEDWVRVNWDFDWSNGEVTVTFHNIDDDYTRSGTYNLKKGLDIESVELANYNGGNWTSSNMDMWWDNIYFTEILGPDVTTQTITDLTQNNIYDVKIENYTEHVSSQSSIASGETYLNELRSTTSYKSLSDSSSIRTTDIFEDVSSHARSSSADTIRVFDIFEDVTSELTTASSNSRTAIDLFESVSSNTSTIDSDAQRVIDFLESINSHAKSSDSTSKRVTDVLASALSQSNKISSASNRNGISFEGRVSHSYSNAIDAKTQRVVDLLESVASSTAISGGGSTRGPLNLENREADNTWSEKATSENKRIIDLLESVNSYSSKSTTESKRVVGLFESVSSHSQPNDSGSIRVVDLSEAVTSHSNSSDSNSIRVIDLIESIASSSSAIESKSSRIVDLLESVSSHSKLGDSDSIRVIDFTESVSSHSNASDSESMRIIDLLESVSSYSKGSRSYSYNERTSLELTDHTVLWDDDKAVWYTNWFKESKIVGNEDELAIRSLVIDDAKDPAAIVKIQYDENGDGKVDDESESIELGKEQLVQTITNIPIDEDGFYRIKVMEYSGYNSLHTLDTAIVH